MNQNPINTLNVTEIKAFIPAKNFEQSKAFYQAIGFNLASEGGGVAYLHYDNASFLLQDFCAENQAENFMMHLLVEDVKSWWNHIQQSGVIEQYGIKVTSIEEQPWAMEDFCMTDPSGVLWRIGQNI